ncbi:kinase-like domain-containing protein [Melanogaster broomeanus]|nr:kinase-like domain-containing protein [Melanogaster broomeanus]
MVCPWLENGALTSYLERRNDELTTEQRLVLLSDVAAGLQHLHSRSVVHGDLSGARGFVSRCTHSNVLIRGNGRACITDFELGDQPLRCPVTQEERWGGLLLSCSACRVSEDEENPQVVPTPQSDMYSFGGIMLQVLTGKVPYYYFTREAQVVHALSRGDTPKRPQASRALITDRRWKFMQRCWSGRFGKVVIVDTRHDRRFIWVIVAVVFVPILVFPHESVLVVISIRNVSHKPGHDKSYMCQNVNGLWDYIVVTHVRNIKALGRKAEQPIIAYAMSAMLTENKEGRLALLKVLGGQKWALTGTVGGMYE